MALSYPHWIVCFVPQENLPRYRFTKIHKINSLLTNFIWSRWLDTGRLLLTRRAGNGAGGRGTANEERESVNECTVVTEPA